MGEWIFAGKVPSGRNTHGVVANVLSWGSINRAEALSSSNAKDETGKTRRGGGGVRHGIM